jgi:quercetin dioxygenase-like cupin family protein
MISMRRIYVTLSLIFFLFGGITTVSAYSNDYTGASVTLIKKATATSDGRKMEYPKTDNPEVTALLVELPPGSETGWHLHPVPVYAYILSGVLTTESGNGQRQDYKEGEAIYEMVNTPHNGRNLGKIPVKLIVFYTGEEGKPVTVRTKHQ